MTPSFIRPLRGRDTSESHRSATPLELFFDLVSVVAIAAAASGLHHALAQDHLSDGLIRYVFSFWAIWWAWMNFTWFASAYDNDDVPYRIAVFVMMAGAMMLAASIPFIFTEFDMGLGVFGYVIMRLALVSLWLRAARHDPARKTTAYRYATGISVCQVLWVLIYFFAPVEYFLYIIVLAYACELSVPWWAESSGETTWHREHMIERYGLLTIIVLGESLLALALAMGTAGKISTWDPQLHLLIASGLVIVFSMWWLYFSEENHHAVDRSTNTGFMWGYGHLVVFGAAAAVGAGLAVQVDFLTDHSVISRFRADAALTIPVSIYLLGLWIVHDSHTHKTGLRRYLMPTVAVAVGGATWLPLAPILVAGALVLSLVIKLRHEATSV